MNVLDDLIVGFTVLFLVLVILLIVLILPLLYPNPFTIIISISTLAYLIGYLSRT